MCWAGLVSMTFFEEGRLRERFDSANISRKRCREPAFFSVAKKTSLVNVVFDGGSIADARA